MNHLQNPIFKDETTARKWLEARIWPNGVVCPHCGTIGEATELHGEAHRAGVYQCNETECREQFTVTVGTVFERSKIPLTKWLMAVFLMAASKKGMSALQIHRMIGVSYKSTWFMCHRIREAMDTGEGGPLGGNGGPVEVDETYWGNQGKQAPGARGWAHKMKVVSLVERNGQKRSFHVANVSAKTVTPILRAQIAKKARLMTDETAVYNQAGKEFASHEKVNHSLGEYTRGDVTTNTVESSFAILKRGLYGTYHHVSEQHLQRYATEFDFKWNHRSKLGFTDTERATAALKGISGKRLTYRRINAQE